MRLGLDLRGGTQIVLEAQDSERQEVNADTVNRTLEVLRRRVDQLGVSEPTLQRSGDRRIIVELPGVTDPDQALRVIGRTAQLTFHPVLGVVQPGRDADNQEDALVLPAEEGERLRLAPAELDGDAVGDAEAVIDPQLGAAWQVAISFRGEGGAQWADLTGRAACRPLGAPRRRVAIVLDERVISSPEVAGDVECDTGITGGETIITGDFIEAEARQLALLIRAGALPVPVEVVEQRTIGPTLGAAAISDSVRAAVIGGAATVLYILVYYRLLGVIAAIALLVYGLISFATLLALRATLTLPGIAGFVLAIGMAVDANVLVFERSKEEFGAGRRLRLALAEGFKKAWSAIGDSNATTVLAAVILFFFASGAVRGFGVTLTVGVVVSMFTALFVTRLFVDLAMRSRSLARRSEAFGMSVGVRLRKRFAERPFDIISRSKLWFVASTVVALVAAAGLVFQGLRFGLEFTGGRLLEYSVARAVNLEEVRDELAGAGLPRAVVQESGDGNVSVRTTELSETQEATVEDIVSEAGGSAELVRDEFVGPSIGNELRRQALIALALGLSAQLAYLAFRFRWTYGTAAVTALFHDVLILLGLFAWLGKDIDGVFIAALLTVIGYSVNDSVVVFDRIREQRRVRRGVPPATVVNDACLQTVPRTINTGLGALSILVALYFAGGQTLTDFALALIVGILLGTYSSVFTAAPLAFVLEGGSTRADQQPEAARRRAAARPPSQQEPRDAKAPEDATEPKEPATAGPSRPSSRPPRSRPRAGPAKRKRRRR
jgi:SecD/SecF fusion protein